MVDEPIDRITRPLKIFAGNKFGGAILLLTAAVAAVIWANSPWSATYTRFLRTVVSLGFGDVSLTKPLILWINHGLMGVFFFVVGLEIKREFLAGELASRRRATLPIAAAIGGMVVPASIYAALNWGTAGAVGWGIPTATDIAFALGVLALLNVPAGLKVFLTALAIVDDIGAVVVIALFYTDTIAVASLLVGGFLLLLSIVANYSGVRSSIVYFLLGSLVWLAFLKSGVHATLAAVLMAMTIPARARIDGEGFLSSLEHLIRALRTTGVPRGKGLMTPRQHHVVEEMGVVVDQATAPLQQLEHSLVPLVTFLVMPVFALANAGVPLGEGVAGGLRHPVGLGIILGLFIGKPIGIVAFSWIAVRLRWAELPSQVDWAKLTGVGMLGGIGFTMSLFIATLAFPTPELRSVAKLGILVGSTLSAVVGTALILSTRSRAAPAAAGGETAVRPGRRRRKSAK